MQLRSAPPSPLRPARAVAGWARDREGGMAEWLLVISIFSSGGVDVEMVDGFADEASCKAAVALVEVLSMADDPKSGVKVGWTCTPKQVRT